MSFEEEKVLSTGTAVKLLIATAAVVEGRIARTISTFGAKSIRRTLHGSHLYTAKNKDLLVFRLIPLRDEHRRTGYPYIDVCLLLETLRKCSQISISLGLTYETRIKYEQY